MKRLRATRFASLGKAAAGVAFALAVPSVHAQSFTVTDLGRFTSANAINDSGTVVGSLENPISGHDNAFTWSNGTFTNQGTFGGLGSQLQGINNSGTIIGEYYDSSYNSYSIYESNGSPTSLTYLTDLGGGSSYMSAGTINSAGTVAGYSTNGSGDTFAFSWSIGSISLTDLGTLGGSASAANGINDSGTIVGYADLAGDTIAHAFSYSDGSMTDLGALGGGNSSAYGINDSGMIVGLFYIGNSNQSHAFSYANGTMTDLGTLGGASSQAVAVNGAGTIVGNSQISGVSGSSDAFVFYIN